MADMIKKIQGLARSTIVERAMAAMTALSGVALVIMLVATFSGVLLRYVFGSPLLGVNEIVQLVSVALVMLAMAPAAHREMHIRVDVFDNAIGRYGRFFGDVLTCAASMYVLAILTLKAWDKLGDAIEFGDATNMLSIPLWPFYGLIALGAAVYGLVLGLQFLYALVKGIEQTNV